MTGTAPGALVPTARVQEMLGLSRAQLGSLVEAGFVQPERGARNEFLFSFQDLMLLRTANTLKQAGIPTRKIIQSLSRLKADLPDDLPLTGLRLTAVGSDVAARDRTRQWTADTGRWLMDFEVQCRRIRRLPDRADRCAGHPTRRVRIRRPRMVLEGHAAGGVRSRRRREGLSTGMAKKEGDVQAALRHFNAYRRLQRDGTS